MTELHARALARESTRCRQLLESGQWRPTSADQAAAAAVLHRLSSQLPVRKGVMKRARGTDRDRRLQRVLRTAVHHLDAGAVTPQAAALLAAVARAFLPWHGTPTPVPAAAAPRYMPMAPPDADAGEALLPDLAALFTVLAAPPQPGRTSVTPPAVPWRATHAGRFRRHGRPARDVWTADTVACPGCGGIEGPWAVACDWRTVELACPCGTATAAHGLSFSEIWLLLPDT